MFLFNLVAFSFQWFDYDVSMHVWFGLLLEFILFVLSVWLMLLFLKNLISSIVPSALFSLSGTSIACTLDGLFLSHNSWMLCLGVCFLFLFSFYNFYFLFVPSVSLSSSYLNLSSSVSILIMSLLRISTCYAFYFKHFHLSL